MEHLLVGPRRLRRPAQNLPQRQSYLPLQEGLRTAISDCEVDEVQAEDHRHADRIPKAGVAFDNITEAGMVLADSVEIGRTIEPGLADQPLDVA